MEESEAYIRWQKKIDDVEREIKLAIKFIFRRKLVELSRAERPAIEMPVPEEIKMDLERALRYRSQSKKMALECLDYIQECLSGTDKEVLRKFKKAMNKSAEQSLSDYLKSGEEKTLSEGFLKAVELEIDRIFERQRKYAASYPLPTQKERALQVSEDVERKYPFLPRYLKALLTQYPYLLEEREVEEKLAKISTRIAGAQSIFEEIERYAVEVYIALLRTSPEASEKFSD